MLQQDEGGDYVVGSGVGHTVRELAQVAFAHVGLEPDDYVVVDPQFVRPLDPVPLVGDASLAHERLGWKPRTSFEEMIGMMVEQDLADLRARHPAASSLG
jgi:GDPmannose 4,6-dehydratase